VVVVVVVLLLKGLAAGRLPCISPRRACAMVIRTLSEQETKQGIIDSKGDTKMEASTEYPGVRSGEGYAVAQLDDLGDGPGFRKIRKGLGVTAFGVNAIVMPPGIESGFHYHDVQEELYFVHRGTVELEFGDGSVQRLTEGGLARVDAATVRKVRNVGDTDAIYLCAGGKDGYIGRDGQVPEGEEQRVRAIHDLSSDQSR
jgi:quercetin dioxygenase-like cupin family protein